MFKSIDIEKTNKFKPNTIKYTAFCFSARSSHLKLKLMPEAPLPDPSFKAWVGVAVLKLIKNNTHAKDNSKLQTKAIMPKKIKWPYCSLIIQHHITVFTII